MKFTFKRNLSILLIKKIFFLLILILLFFFLTFYFKNGVGKFLVGTILFIQFSITLFNTISLLVSVYSFFNNLSQDKKDELEKELSISIFSCETCYLTNKYVFLLANCNFIDYSDIDKITVSTSIRLRPNSNLLSMIYFRIKLHLNEHTYLCFETNSALLKNNFINILVKKNPNIKIQKNS